MGRVVLDMGPLGPNPKQALALREKLVCPLEGGAAVPAVSGHQGTDYQENL